MNADPIPFPLLYVTTGKNWWYTCAEIVRTMPLLRSAAAPCTAACNQLRPPPPITHFTGGRRVMKIAQRLKTSFRVAARNFSDYTIPVTPSSTQALDRVVNASLALIQERARAKAEVVAAAGGAEAVSCLVGIPLGHNSSYHRGTAFAPPFVREAIWSASANSTTEEGMDLSDPRKLADVGDFPIQELQGLGIQEEHLMQTISDSVKLVMGQPYLRPLIIGGDHSISYPIVRAVSQKLGGPVDILHIDAHPDLYDAFEGNKFSHASSFARIMEGGYARRLLQVGIRSINKEGREQAKRFGVELFEMRHYEEHRKYLENLELGQGVKGVYISIDVDCLDPGFAPGVSHIESGGLSFRDVMRILQNLKGNIVAGDVVEYNPQRDTSHQMTAMVASKFVRELVAILSK